MNKTKINLSFLMITIIAVGILCIIYDWEFLYFIQKNLRCAFLDFFFSNITALGNVGIIWIACGVAMLFFKKYRKHGLILLIGLLAGALVGNVFLKNVIARSRPCWEDQSIALLINVPKDYSFPSGHTLSSTIGAIILTISNKKFGYAAIPLAVVISLSRLYLFVHFPTDVFSGMVIGLIVGFATYFVAKNIIKNKFNTNL